ncbi:TonB-dependent receptor [Rhodocytophaga aerolata]|uniref:TonB-dependent receptor n=1 Tax=Rhodocytophaga aerolata TaxID=455078 RepID=A0ABT8RBZ9_9BACT|nr:TonB-dependent receptor [Rhodocytophaga aerolata]MDO1449595.1 TonB-dependent receptor [Rhodocytophaga aerolata]
MVRLFTCLFTILFPFFTYAQQRGSIEGNVKDSEHQFVEFATVFIAARNDSSKILTGTTTDSMGHFVMDHIPFGSYMLHVQFLGYKKQMQAVALNQDNKQIVLTDIILEPDAKVLEGVEVRSLRNMIQRTEEGIVMDASQNLTQIGGTAADLLRNMPGVLVGAEGGVSLRGRNPLILINGRVSGISGTDRSTNLQQIPASSIERIEIITNPSAKYDADAEGGIINIVLKKSSDGGTNGAFALGAGFGERYRLNGTLMLNHKTSKWNVGIAYDNWYTTRTRRVHGDRTQFTLPDQYYLTQRRFDERTVGNQTARVNIDYTPNTKNQLSFEALWLFQSEDNNETLLNTTQTAELDFTGRNQRFSNEVRHFHTGEALLTYTKKLNQPKKQLTFNLSSALNIDRENTDISTQALSAQNIEVGNPFLQRTYNYENSSLTSFSVDYTHPLQGKGLIETGAKTILRFLDNDFLRENQLNESFAIDAANTDQLSFKEQIHALYTQYTGWIGEESTAKWKYQVGLRGEQVWNNGDLRLNPMQFSNRYFNLFPSGSIIYTPQKATMAKLAYSKRINRPTFGQLIPFTDITDSLNQRKGNPQLKPELAHALELSYSRFFEGGSFTTSVFFRSTSRVILPYTILYNTGVAFTLPLNFGRGTTYGMEGIFVYQPFAFWNINLNLSAYNSRIVTSEASLNLERNQFTYFAKLINNFTPWARGQLQLIGNYTSPIAIPQGENVEVYFVDFGFQQSVMKGQGRIGLTVTDVFNTQRYGFRNADTNFVFSRIFKLDTRAFMLTFGYTFKSSFKEKLMENKFTN